MRVESRLARVGRVVPQASSPRRTLAAVGLSWYTRTSHADKKGSLCEVVLRNTMDSKGTVNSIATLTI